MKRYEATRYCLSAGSHQQENSNNLKWLKECYFGYIQDDTWVVTIYDNKIKEFLLWQ